MRRSQSQFGPVACEYLSSGVHSNEASLRRLVGAARPQGGVVLDVGTGAGHAALAFAPLVDAVVASDITAAMLEIVRSEIGARGLSNVSPCFAAAEQLPFRDGAFDGIVTRLAAHHFEDPEAFVRESRRCLRPGGWLLVVDNVGIEDEEADRSLDTIERLRDPSHSRNWTESAWRAWLAETGFEVEFCERAPKPMNAADWLGRMRVEPDRAEEIVEIVRDCDGWLRDYLRPHGEGEMFTFHLHEMLLLARWPSPSGSGRRP